MEMSSGGWFRWPILDAIVYEISNTAQDDGLTFL
jgi:hypothetical protein